MFPFSHFFSGYFLGSLLAFIGLVEITNLSVILFGIFSLLPDFDSFFNRRMKDHHKTFFHSPLFWISVSLIVITAGSFEIGIIICAMTLFHILTDYITGRTIGIAPFYPFSGKEFSLYELNDETASMDIIRPNKNILKKHLALYTENKPLLVFELILNLLGVISLISLILFV